MQYWYEFFSTSAIALIIGMNAASAPLHSKGTQGKKKINKTLNLS